MFAEFFITYGLAILAGIFAGSMLNKLKIPAVAGYVLIGILLGPSLLNIFHKNIIYTLDGINFLALSFIAILIGSEIEINSIKKLGKTITWIVICEAFGAFAFIFICVFLFSKHLELSLLLAAIGSATAPAATIMVINQYNAKGPLTKTLLSVVAIDDAISLLIFSFALTYTKSILSSGNEISILSMIQIPVIHIGLSLLVSLILNIILILILRNIKSNHLRFLTFIGFALVQTGIAEMYHLSELIMAMMTGFLIINFLNPSKNKPLLDKVREFTPPLFIAFFVTAGAHLNIFMIFTTGFIGLLYFISRASGKILGARLGGLIGKSEIKIRKYIGYGLLSQVGVGIGLALFVTRELQEFGIMGHTLSSQIINIILSTTILTELFGPILTKYALSKAKEININTEGN